MGFSVSSGPQFILVRLPFDFAQQTGPYMTQTRPPVQPLPGADLSL
ncbi:hypothetical protein COLO4_38393 [Corchorus olitorius]|uniref:Uncharacterized protein n=1 Tax=Corchorus olitorius TaxID=93759 RepID=A0A1R3FV89_9ROSI|nr:hypothetical protein COLO4_38393 [Corchorus olitorius]